MVKIALNEAAGAGARRPVFLSVGQLRRSVGSRLWDFALAQAVCLTLRLCLTCQILSPGFKCLKSSRVRSTGKGLSAAS